MRQRPDPLGHRRTTTRRAADRDRGDRLNRGRLLDRRRPGSNRQPNLGQGNGNHGSDQEAQHPDAVVGHLSDGGFDGLADDFRGLGGEGVCDRPHETGDEGKHQDTDNQHHEAAPLALLRGRALFGGEDHYQGTDHRGDDDEPGED